MGITKKIVILFLGVFLGVSFPIIAQGLPGASIGKSFLLPRELVVSSANMYRYMRNPETVSGYGFATDSPAFGIRVVTPTATLENNGTTQISGNFIKQIRKTQIDIDNASAAITTVNVDMRFAQEILITINVTAAGKTLIITGQNHEHVSNARPLTVILAYTGTQVLTALNFKMYYAYRVPPGVTVTAVVPVKWPFGDGPIFTKVSGKTDIISLFYSGLGWGDAVITGEYYATISYNY